MTANEKRAVALLKTLGLVAEDGVYLRWMEAAVKVFDQEAERRGEERVLRWFTHMGEGRWAGDYRKASRARGGKRS